ncbi:FTL, partial [Cervus elaphus hippelaphus]
NYATPEEAAVNHLVSRHLRASSCTYLSLGFSRATMWARKVRKSRDPNVCRRPKTAVAAMPSSGMPMPSQDECSKTQDAKEALVVLEKHLNQAFQICMPYILPRQTPSSESHFLEEQVKLIKKVRDHMTDLHRLPGPQAGLHQYLFQMLTLSAQLEASQSPTAFEETVWHPPGVKTSA